MKTAHRRAMPALAAAALALTASGCASTPASTDETSETAWSYTDSRGELIELDAAPENVVALSYIGLALDSYGVGLAGQFSYGGLPASLEDSPIADLPIAGDTEVDLEKLAAMDPDVIITMDWDSGVLDSLSGIEQQTAQIAPIITVSASAPLDEQLEQIAGLAVALDPGTEEVVSGEAEQFADAQAALAAAAEARPEITVAAMQTNTIVESQPDSANGARIFYPEQVGTVGLLVNLGLDVVVPDGDGQWAQNLSAEEVDKYPADVILHKVDEWSTGGDDVNLALWPSLPAVAAGQVYVWDETWSVLTYENWTRILNEIAEFVTAADDVVTE